jgi:GNAT superfamily N-acetyltransferase
MYLDDLVVRESKRQLGIGKLLFDRLVARSKEIGAKRLSWQVLDWNEPAIKFYEKINAELDSEWINCRFTKEGLDNYK